MLFFTTHDKVGGWGVCLGIFFCFDIYFIASTKLFWQTQTPYGKTEVNSRETFLWLFTRKPHHNKANNEDPNNSFRSSDLPETLDWIQQLSTSYQCFYLGISKMAGVLWNSCPSLVKCDGKWKYPYSSSPPLPFHSTCITITQASDF